MELALIGLGAMGSRMAHRLVKEHRLVAFDQDPEAGEGLEATGAVRVQQLSEVAAHLTSPRMVWLMLPAGAPTEATLEALLPQMAPGDIVVDGGNSHYRDSMRRASLLEKHGVHFLDVGTSGGEEGGDRGYGLMVGGPASVVDRIAPILRSLAADPVKGWGRVGPNGAGHFAKMVHNGVEYGLMRAYAQGLSVIEAQTTMELDLETVTGIWQSGAMARSAILGLTHEALTLNPELGALAPYVADAGRGRWTREEAVDQVAQRGYDRDQFA